MEGQLAHIGAGLAAIGSGAAAIGVGTVAGNYLAGALRNPVLGFYASSVWDLLSINAYSGGGV